MRPQPRNPHADPELALVAGTLLAAIKEAMIEPPPDAPTAAARHAQAWRWIRSPSCAPFSFRWCCSAIDIDPECALAALRDRSGEIVDALRRRRSLF